MVLSWSAAFEHLIQVGGITAAGTSYELCFFALFGFVPIRKGGKVIFYCNKQAPVD